jgi:hypothetical protein
MSQDVRYHTQKDIEEAVAKYNSFPPSMQALFRLDFTNVTPKVLEQLRLLHPDWFEPDAAEAFVVWHDPGESQAHPEDGL